ncbi:MAG: DUF6968 family protein [Pseudolabrys sp.]
MIIATRHLILRGADGDRDIRIDIFQPEQKNGAWTCRYEINWPKEKWASFAGCADAVQSLVLALQKIATEIYFSDFHKSGKLIWETSGQGYGFPLPPSAREKAVGDDIKFY